MVAALVVGITMGVFAIGAGAQIKSGIGVKAGYFMTGDEELKEMWGGGIAFGADYLFLLTPSYGIDVGVDYFSQVSEGITLTIMPITGSFIYAPGGGNLYLGAGAGYYTAQVSGEGEQPAQMDSLLTEPEVEIQSALGYHAFFIEGKYSTAKIEEWGVDVGGISVFGGVRL